MSNFIGNFVRAAVGQKQALRMDSKVDDLKSTTFGENRLYNSAMKNINNILLVTLLLLSLAAQAQTLEGRVVGVADGDTITILDSKNNQYKIRLAGIDAPEKKQPFGNVSKKSLSNLVYGKQVSVDYNKQDRYGRTVGKVVIEGIDANLEQVKRGFAWFYKKYQNEMVLDDRLDYLHAQQQAAQSKVGLWVDHSPIPPWDFRKSKKTVTPAETTAADELPSQPVVSKKAVIVTNDSAKLDSEHCYNLETDHEVLECLK